MINPQTLPHVGQETLVGLQTLNPIWGSNPKRVSRSTVMKTAKTGVSQSYRSGQGSPVTTWADTLSCTPRSSTKEAANHKHEHQTCYLLVAASKVYTKVHDSKVGLLTCPRLM